MQRWVAVVVVVGIALAAAGGAAAAPATRPGVVGSFSIGGGTHHLAHAEVELGWRVDPVIRVLARAQAILVGEKDSAAELGVAVRFDGGDAVRGYLEPQLAYLSYGAEYDCSPGHPGDCWGGTAGGVSTGLVAGVHVFTTDHVSGDLRVGASWFHWRDATTNARKDDVLVVVGGGFSFY